jgi:hypothetical protein
MKEETIVHASAIYRDGVDQLVVQRCHFCHRRHVHHTSKAGAQPGLRYRRDARCGLGSYSLVWDGIVLSAHSSYRIRDRLLSEAESQICVSLHVAEHSYRVHRQTADMSAGRPPPTAAEIRHADIIRRIARKSARRGIALSVIAIPLW